MSSRYLTLPVLVACATVAIASNARAASFTGTVTLPDGRPAFGAMVSVFNADHSRRQTVYTAADGSYAIVTPYEGSLGRSGEARQLTRTQRPRVDAARGIGGHRRTCSSRRSPMRRRASDALAASAHNAMLQWKLAGGPARIREPVQLLPPDRQFHDACAAQPRGVDGHHQQDGRLPRDGDPGAEDPHCERVREGIRRQARKGDAGLWRDHRTVARQGRGVAGGRRVLVHPRHGRGRATGSSTAPTRATTSSGCWIPRPAKVESFDLPPSGLPRGGIFSGMHLAIGMFTGSHGPHSMAQTSTAGSGSRTRCPRR